MKNTILTLVGAAAILALAQTSNAIPITGSIGFSGNANLNSGTAATATTVTSWSSTTVLSDAGIIASLLPGGTSVTFAQPWNFTVSSLINNFWQVASVPIGFDLQSFTFTRGTLGGNPYVAIAGTGLIHTTAAGGIYDPTLWDFSVTFQDPASVPANQTFTFSASQHSVPDGGTTVLLLGAALSGMALIKRKLTA